MGIKFKIKGGLAIPPRFANRALKDEFQRIGETWHAKHRPRHFTLDGARRYGYTQRSRGYNRRKRKKLGTVLPLVWTGESRNLAKVATVKPKKDAVAITMPVRKFNFRVRNSTVRMLQEFRTISPDEIAAYEKQAVKNIEKKITAYYKTFPNARPKLIGA